MLSKDFHASCSQWISRSLGKIMLVLSRQLFEWDQRIRCYQRIHCDRSEQAHEHLSEGVLFAAAPLLCFWLLLFTCFLVPSSGPLGSPLFLSSSLPVFFIFSLPLFLSSSLEAATKTYVVVQ